MSVFMNDEGVPKYHHTYTHWKNYITSYQTTQFPSIRQAITISCNIVNIHCVKVYRRAGTFQPEIPLQ